jgi:UDP:flavonoid glycosyltransferase YjiC (YdhE family)
MTPKKILLMAHDVTLAHLGPLRLAEGLIADGHDVTLAASAESARFLKDFPGRVHTLAPTGKARFIDNLAKGRPVFDFESLKRFAEEDEALLTALRPDLVIGDFRITLSISARRAGIPYATITNAYWHPALEPRFVVRTYPSCAASGSASRSGYSTWHGPWLSHTTPDR